MEKYHYKSLQPYHYYVVRLDYEYPNDQDEEVKFERLLGLVTTDPKRVNYILAEYFNGDPLSKLNEQEIADLPMETHLKMLGADMVNEIDSMCSSDANNCMFSINKIEEVSFSAFETLKKHTNIHLINVHF